MSIIQSGGAHNVDSADAVFDHTIGQSLRFDAAGYLTRDTGEAGNTTVYTTSFWVKRSGLTSHQYIFSAGPWSGGNNFEGIRFVNDDTLRAILTVSNSTVANFTTNNKFRDVSAWYHIVWQRNGQAYKIYVNGTEQTYSTSTFSSNPNGYLTADTEQLISGRLDHLQDLDGYLAEFNFVDGSALDPTSFGETKGGVWVPKAYSGSYGTTGFYLTFSDSSSIGADSSGLSHTFTVSGLVASDVVPDSPTNNFATANPLAINKSSPWTTSEGNLKILTSANNKQIRGNFLMQSGKWYWETRRHNANNNDAQLSDGLGIALASGYIEDTPYTSTTNWSYYSHTGKKRNGSTNASYGDTWNSAGDIIGVAFDADNGVIWFSKNGTWQNSATTSEIAAGTTTNAAFTGLTDSEGYVCQWWRTGGNNAEELDLNFGQNPSFNAELTGGDVGTESGDGSALFKYAPPTGFKALTTSNLSDITIGPGQDQQADDFFETMLYTGNGTEQHIGSSGARHPQDTISIANSLRLNDDDSGKLYFDPDDDGNKQIFTFSAWVKRTTFGVDYQVIFGGKNSGGNQTDIRFDSSDQLRIVTAAASLTMDFKTNRTFKSITTWYHIVVAVDTTDSTLLNRVKIYVDGVQETNLQTTTCTKDTICILNTASNQTTNVGALGYTTTVSNEFDGYLAEVNFVDGTQLDPTYFGQVGSNGDWVPKTITGVTYGTNGFRLNFADSSDLGNDVSGRNNDFTVITSTFIATDQVIDSPTQNFAVLDPNYINGQTQTFSEGNLDYASSQVSPNNPAVVSNFAVNTGKWYWEVYIRAQGNTVNSVGIASKPNDLKTDSSAGYLKDWAFSYQASGSTRNNADVSYGNSWTTGDIIGVALDLDAGTVKFYKNGTVQNSGTAAFTGLSSTEGFTSYSLVYDNGAQVYNFGQDDSFNNNKPSGTAGAADANGVGAFYYSVPSGHLALMDDNIPQEGIKSPDWVWIKQRNADVSHYLFDSVRGPGKDLHSDVGNQEATDHDTLRSFDSQGFTVGNDDHVNDEGDTYVAWTWKAGGEPTTDNTAAADATPTAGSVKIDGVNKTDAFSGSPDLAVTRLSASTTAGFSIVAYTGSSSNPKTVPHGLTQSLDAIIVKRREGGDSWAVGHASHGFNNSSNLRLEESSNASSGANGFSSDPDANVFTVGSEPVVNSASDYIAYCFHSVEGYSKFGSYVGNGNANGTFIYTGFRPAWVMLKGSDTSGNWFILDTTRSTFNEADDRLNADVNSTESTSNSDIDFLSNGFKIRTASTAGINQSTDTHIFFAFAEAPFKFANAR